MNTSALTYSAVMKATNSPERGASGFVQYANRTASGAILANLPTSPPLVAPSPPTSGIDEALWRMSTAYDDE